MLRRRHTDDTVKTLTGSARERLLLLSDPVAPGRLGTAGWIVGFIALLVIACPPLFTPLDSDSALFLVCGKMISSNGAIHYRDIIDIKFPGIYYLYALFAIVTGGSPSGVRIADYAMQIVTALSIIAVVRHALRNDLTAILSGFFYLLLYSGQSYRNTAQCESYLALLCFPLLYLLLEHRTVRGYLIAGIIVGLAAMLKITFAILLPAMMLVELTLIHDRRSGWKESLRLMASASLGLAVVIALFLLYLTAGGAWHGFALMQDFIKAYSTIQWASPMTAVTMAYESLGSYFGAFFSLTFTLLLITAIPSGINHRGARHETMVVMGKPERSDPADREQIDREKRVRAVRYLATWFVLFLFTIILEGKYGGWYFSRLHGPGAVLVAIGMVALLHWLGRRWHDGYARLITMLLLPFALLLSPLPRYAYHSMASLAYLRDGRAGIDRYYRTQSGSIEAQENTHVEYAGLFIRSRLGAEEELFVFSGSAGILYLAADRLPESPFVHSSFLIAPYAPQEWRDRARSYILQHRPEVIALDNDGMEPITASPLSSGDAFRNLPGLSRLLAEEYDTIYSNARIVMYRHTGSSLQ